MGQTKDPTMTRLKLFMEGAIKGKRDQKFQLYLTSISRARLGMYFFHMLKCHSREAYSWGEPAEITEAYKTRHTRSEYAKDIVEGTYRRSFFSYLSNRTLYDLFIHANEMKSRALFRQRGYKLTPSEVIPFENCRVAQIVHRSELEFLSFNPDYQYFANFRRDPGYIKFQQFEDFLTVDFPAMR